MMAHCFLAFLFFSLQLLSSFETTISHINNSNQRSSFHLSGLSEDISVEELHRHSLTTSKNSLISSKSLRAINTHHALSFSTKKINVAGQTITRSTPILDDIPVEGADGIFNGNSYQNQFHFTPFESPRAPFRLSAAECMEKAISHTRFSAIKNPYVENTNGIYQPIWLMHFGELRPAFKVRLPTISILDLRDMYIDADNGDVLRIDDVAQFAQAPSSLFVYSPETATVNDAELKAVSLKNLTSLAEDDFLRGQYISVSNCCKFYTCPEEGPCSDERKRCALRSHNNAQQTRELLDLPTATLGLDPLMSLPETISVDTVRCTNLPFARASLKSSDSQIIGFFEKPIDDGSPESEMDRFSEIQAYFSMMSFFNNIRSLLNDNTWCLREEAMSCNSDGSPIVDEQGNAKNPYRVYVNQMIPDMKVDDKNQQHPDNFLLQILSGKGTPDNPIKLDELKRIGNAAFVPALSTLKKNAPRADEILSDLIKPFDHNVFFQGERDFAYDGDVVFHEFMHAITTSLISKINSLGLDQWGINSEPGGLNESWSDYFSAAFTDDPVVGKYASIRGGFGEAGLRNIDNDASCPNDVIGEIHNDGLIWSGALWEIRSALKNSHGMATAKEFDRAVLASLSEAKTTEDFKTQSEKLINNIKARDGLSEKAAALATSVFDKRGITDCFRAYTLSSVDKNNRLTTRIKNMLFVASKTQIGLKNYAPATSQLEIGIPAGATGVTLSWRQFLGGTGALLGTEATPDTTKNSLPLKILTSFELPITWKFQGARAIPTQEGQAIEDEPHDAVFRDGYWQTHIPINAERCEQKTMYVSLLSNDFKYVLENLSVHFDVDNSDDRSDCNFTGSVRVDPRMDGKGCSTTGINGILLMLVLCLGAVIRWARPKRSVSAPGS